MAAVAVLMSVAPSIPRVEAAGPPNGDPFVVGFVDVGVGWVSVSLVGFVDPVVVVGGAGFVDSAPVTVRVRDVGPSGFEVRLEEFVYQDGPHGVERVPYVVVEAGSHVLASGAVVEAGRVLVGSSPEVTVGLSGPFPGVPVVVASVSSTNELDAVVTRVRSVTGSSFRVRVQEEEALGSHVGESVEWVAWSTGVESSGIDSVAWETVSVSTTQNFATVNFAGSYIEACYVGAMNTLNGTDPATVRYRSLSSSSVQVQVDEEQSANTEVYHTWETIVGLVFECYEPPESLGDLVWADTGGGDPALAGNGIQDPGEPGIGGVNVELLDDTATVVVDSTVTDAAGAYLFTGVDSGVGYVVRFVVADGQVFTVADVGDDATDSDADPVTGVTGVVSLSEGEHDLTRDAGVFSCPLTAGVVVSFPGDLSDTGPSSTAAVPVSVTPGWYRVTAVSANFTPGHQVAGEDSEQYAVRGYDIASSVVYQSPLTADLDQGDRFAIDIVDNVVEVTDHIVTLEAVHRSVIDGDQPGDNQIWPLCVTFEPVIDFDVHTNSQDADSATGPLPALVEGNPITWTYQLTNHLHDPIASTDIAITDTVNGTITTPPAGDNGNLLLEPGETWTYQTTGTATTHQPGDPHTVTGICNTTPNHPIHTLTATLTTTTGTPTTLTDPTHHCTLSSSLLQDWLPESTIADQPIPSTGDLYVATTGDDNNPGTEALPLATLQKAVDSAEPGNVILVREGTYNQSVHFGSSNSGTAGQYITLAAYPGEEVILDGTGVTVPEAITISGLILIESDYIRVSGFTVQDVTGTDEEMGISTEYGSHLVIDNNHTIRTASAGIGLWHATSVIVRNNRVQDARTTGTQECLSVAGTTQFELSYNEVWNTQTWSQECEGIDVKGGSSHGKVVKNVAHDLPHQCFYVDGYSTHTHHIDLYANVAYNCSMGIVLTSEREALLEHVRVFDNLIHDNHFIGIGFPAWPGSLNTGSISNIEIFNNTIDNRRVPYPGNPTGLLFKYPSISDITVKNNIIATNGVAFTFETSVTNLVVDHNLIDADTISTGMPGFADPHLVQGDPLFVDFAADDYHLSATSPAIDQGDPTVSLAFDLDAAARPQGAAIDIGAYEY